MNRTARSWYPLLDLLLLPLVLAVPLGAQVAGPVVVDGQAQIVEAFADTTTWIREDLWVETDFDSDGDGLPDRVHVDVTRPGQTESGGLKLPVIYATSPYYAGTAGIDFEHFWDVGHAPGEDPPARPPMDDIAQQERRPVISNAEVSTWVPRGFAVVHSSSPGTGLSQGCPTVGGPNEALAPKAVIDWLNGRATGWTAPVGGEEVVADWSTGKVGMTGTSYNGTLPVAAATTGVEGLEAIIPIAPNTSYWHYYRSHGLVRSPGGYPGEDVDVLFDFIYSGPEERRAYCRAQVRDGEMAAGMDRRTGDYNDFWAGRDYLNQMDDFRAALLMSHGFNDWNVMPEHSLRIYERAREMGVPAAIYYHQGGHGGPPPLEMRNRWFTRWLLGVENGVEGEPRAWIVREGDPPSEPTPYPDFPNPAAETVELRPAGDGTGIGSLAAASTARADGTLTIVDDARIPGGELAALASSPARLLFVTEPLAAPLHISGTPRLRIRLSADRPFANLSVWLVKLPWEGEPDDLASVVTRGWADPTNRNDPARSTPLAPGEWVELAFTLQPDDQIIPAGARLGLMIFSSDREFTLRPPPGTRLTVELSATVLELPVVDGAAGLVIGG